MIVLGAAAWDVLLGEPPRRVHPVVGMGRLLDTLDPQRRVTGESRTDTALGAVSWAISLGVVSVTTIAAMHLVAKLPAPLRLACKAFLLKSAFAHRMLVAEGVAVEEALADSLESGRLRLSHLVSRPTDDLTEGDVREAAIEAIAENINDSVVAPLFWYAIGGLPGAMAYRMVNTADAMWGYRGAREYTGRVAAVADDVASWLPARLSGLLIRPHRLRETARAATPAPSPNSGWPMAAMALQLNVRLSKPGQYVLNESGQPPAPRDVARAASVADRVFVASVLGSAFLAWRRRG